MRTDKHLPLVRALHGLALTWRGTVDLASVCEVDGAQRAVAAMQRKRSDSVCNAVIAISQVRYLKSSRRMPHLQRNTPVFLPFND